MSEQIQFQFPNRLVGYRCSCCGLYVKEYERSYNHNMAFVIANLYSQNRFDWVHIEKWLKENNFPRCGDFSYNVMYGLLEKMLVKRLDTSDRNGYYKLTGRGILFAESKYKVWKKFRTFDGEFQGFVEIGKNAKEITIQDALGVKFNYLSLMQNQ